MDDLFQMGDDNLCREMAIRLRCSNWLTKYLLGIEIIIRDNAVLLSQRQCVKDVFKIFHMSEFNGTATPEVVTEAKVKAPKSNEHLLYRWLVGALQFMVSGSRPDIAVVESICVFSLLHDNDEVGD
ncbi:TPA: hypothetical protein N0F65_006099 [Lagenidium giganteum]|uniref:Uncharacterized protein n=1 Tax=Lagenidium giganteum TaxID=4803 RepID=A0AAV2Z679_9STRA|nr:TPA: hypothetical protein N0F65_006099 [Lagenidium giganteum]